MTKRASSMVLILANLIPLAGVVLFEWDVLAILLLYWAESVIIGVLNVFRMIFCQSDDVMQRMLRRANRPIPEELSRSLPRISVNVFKFILVPFFIVHYGAFCYGHLSLVVAIFGDGEIGLRAVSALAGMSQGSFWISVAAIFASHLFSFFTNYIGAGEYRRTSLFLLMQRPYGRIMVMQASIIFGAGLVTWLGTQLPMLLVLIVVKTAVDIRMHEKERGKLGEPAITPA